MMIEWKYLTLMVFCLSNHSKRKKERKKNEKKRNEKRKSYDCLILSLWKTKVYIIVNRKKRKWDQPAESLVSAGLALPGVFPLGSMANLIGISLPVVAPLSGALVTNSVPASGASAPQIFQAPTIQQNAVAMVQKLNQVSLLCEFYVVSSTICLLCLVTAAQTIQIAYFTWCHHHHSLILSVLGWLFILYIIFTYKHSYLMVIIITIAFSCLSGVG